MPKTTILMLLDNPLTSDNRVEKEARSLVEAGFEVTIVATLDETLPEFEHRDGYKIHRLLNPFYTNPLHRNYRKELENTVSNILQYKFDIIHCHDFMLMPLAAKIKTLNPSVFFTYDSHEYLHGWPYYREIESPINRLKGYFVWLRFLYNEKKSAKHINCLLTPSRGISNAQKKSLNLKFNGIAVRNLPQIDRAIKLIDLKKNLGVLQHETLLIHSGSIYMPQSILYQLISWVADTKDLNLLIVGNRPIHQKLKIQFQNSKSIFFLDYDASNLAQIQASCDIGLIYTRSDEYLAHKLGSSNKLMEFSLVGTPIVGTSQDAHIELNERFNHIEMFQPNNFENLQSAIKRMIASLPEKKKNAQRIKHTLSWENEFRPVIELYKKVAASQPN